MTPVGDSCYTRSARLRRDMLEGTASRKSEVGPPKAGRREGVLQGPPSAF